MWAWTDLGVNDFSAVSVLTTKEHFKLDSVFFPDLSGVTVISDHFLVMPQLIYRNVCALCST